MSGDLVSRWSDDTEASVFGSRLVYDRRRTMKERTG
jgi:hypothetical protein